MDDNLEKTLPSLLGNPEGEKEIEWTTLTRENALDMVGEIRNLLDSKFLLYLRTTPDAQIEWKHIFEKSHSSTPVCRVQFHTEPEVAQHWICVEYPLQGADQPQYITIREGESFYISHERGFLALRSDNWHSDLGEAMSQKNPQTKYELYIPSLQR